MPVARACRCRSKQPVRYVLVCLWLIALPASAQVYKSLDAHGTVHFGNTPRDLTGSAPITLGPLNLQPALKIAPPDNPQHLLPEQERAHPPYTALKIDGLPVEQALRANNGTFPVQLTIDPPLHSQHRLQWLLDDQPYGEPDTQTVMHVNNIDRGRHSLSVKVMEGDETVQQSQTVVFYLQRARQK